MSRRFNIYKKQPNLGLRIFLAVFPVTFLSVSSLHARHHLDEEMESLLEMDITKLMNVEVVTATRHKQALAEVAATTVVITEEDIKNYGYRDLKDVLKHTLGVEYGFPASWVQGGFRGFGNNFAHTKLYVNGLENNLFWTGEAFNSNQYTLNNVKQIEIVFGPASTLYGADAFSGVINIITKNAENAKDGTWFSIAKTDSHYIKASYNSIETLGDLSISFSGTHLDDNGPDYQDFVLSPEFSEVSLLERQQITAAGKPYRDENRSNNINLDLKYELSDKEKISTGIYWWENRDGGGQEVAHLEFNTRDELREQLHTYIKYEYLFDDEATKLSVKYDHASEFDEINGPNTTNPSGLTLPAGPPARLFKVSNQKLNQLDLQVDHDFNKTNNYLVMGLTYRDFELPNPVSIDAGVTTNTFAANFPFLNHTKTSFYIQDQQYLYDKKLQLSLGWRFDNSSIYDAVNTTRASAYWKFNKSNGIKLLYGEAFREPTIFELESNNVLEPSEIKSYETAYVYNYGMNVSGQFSLFMNKGSNLIEVDRTVTPAVGSNSGKSKIRGVESRLKWHHKHINGYFDISYSEDPNDKKLINIARFKYLLGMSYHYSDSLTLSLQGKHTAAINTEITKTAANVTPKVIEPLKVPKYTSFDFTVRKNPIAWRGTPVKIELLFSIKNLFNERNLFANIRGLDPYVFLDEERTYFFEAIFKY